MRKELLQPVTQKVKDEVRHLIGEARHAALAVFEIGTNHPAISRVAMATLNDGTPLLLTSELAPHTACLRANQKCSILVGEVGKGDPMAHPRATLFCIAKALDPALHKNMRERFLAHHPKSQNYIDLPDFGFWQLEVERISYNAGFGRAFAISGKELVK